MVALPSFDIRAVDAKQTWITEKVARLPPALRAKYDSNAAFRGVVHTALEQEWRDPEGVAIELKARATYGSDFEREASDFDAGRHPFQKQR